MTRINVVPVDELSDQWLLAEYRELPRVVKQNINISDAPAEYCLGKGHMKWARRHLHYVLVRYLNICLEMKIRGFKPQYSYSELKDYARNTLFPKMIFETYYETDKDIDINRQRLIEKYKMKPDFYRWTRRNKPKWIEG